MFLVASTPRPRSEPVVAVAAAHWSNIQLTRVELSTLDATTRIEESCRRRNTALPQLGFGAKGVWKSRDKERGKRRAGGKHLVDKATNIYNAGQPVDEQKTRKLKASSVGVSDIRRQNRQERRNGKRQEKVRWEESLSVWNGQRKRKERAGGAGQ